MSILHLTIHHVTYVVCVHCRTEVDGLDQRSISVFVVVARSDRTSQNLDWNSLTDRAYKQGMLCMDCDVIITRTCYRKHIL